MERLQTFSVSICNGSKEGFCYGKLLQKLIFRFYVTITDADVGNQKALHTLLDKYLDHMLVKFELNRLIRNIQNSKLLGKNG